tara:strand:- start:265 stop:591 length:327 start_codon:yes stop_codon:yes gene_type:complete
MVNAPATATWEERLMAEFFVICCILFGCAATVSLFRGLVVFFIGFVAIAGMLGALAGATSSHDPAPPAATTTNAAPPKAAPPPSQPQVNTGGLRLCRNDNDQGPCLQK